MRLPSRIELILFLFAILVRVGFMLTTNFTADDAYITFRYAEMIADGFGFVYNPGEPVLGTTTPLFTLILAAARTIGIDVATIARIISLLAAGTTTILLYRFARGWDFREYAWVPAMVYAIWPRSIPADSSGMETALFTALALASLYHLHGRRMHWSVTLASLAALTRPEGGLLVGIVLVLAVIYERRSFFRLAAISVCLLLPWFLFASSYFGSPIPHSVTAKLALYAGLALPSPLERMIDLLWLDSPYGVPLLILVALGFLRIRREQSSCWCELSWVVLFLGFFAMSRTHLFFWYVAPVYPVLLLFACAGALRLLSRLERVKKMNRWIGHTVIATGLAGIAISNIVALRAYADQARYLENHHAAIGHFLRENASEKERVAAEDIGLIGYISGRVILDRDGLVSPDAVLYNRVADYAGLIAAERPDWVVAGETSPISRFVTDSTFLSDYSLAQTFRLGNAPGYLLFRRK